MKPTPPKFESYEAFHAGLVEECHAKGWLRLDGETTGSSRRVAARLCYDGKCFKVDEDSLISSLRRPMQIASECGKSLSEVLRVVRTRGGKGQKLELLPKYDTPKLKRFYVYLDA